ncbi:MAG: FecR domain-containing protein [Acidobacteria bacterium]|nr:FecR domain-containing protein [Acidobacteriota bacterium]
MPSNPFDKRTRGWYTVSVDTLRGGALLVLLAVLGFFGWVGYQRWMAGELEREAGTLLQEVSELLARAEATRPSGAFGEELDAARRAYEGAVADVQVERYGEAVAKGRRSRALLLALLESGPTGAGEAQFIAVSGGVEYRRGERGEWEEARSRVVLQSGDYVKTAGNGSAEIVFLDGTLYTVRPNTLFLVTRKQGTLFGTSEQAIRMEYGWVDLNTAQRGGRVETPRAEARVARESEAAVTFDQTTSSGTFVAYRGAIDVETADGETQRIESLQQLSQRGDKLAQVRQLPAEPLILRPNDNLELALETADKVVLAWDPVAGAARYALQVSRNRLFVDNLIDVDARATTSATLGLKGEGTFEWRVAARNREGLQGPWSTPRTFRILASRGPGEAGDVTPPPLELDQVQAYGSIFILSGRTEAGASVRVNGEQVAVEANGTFTKTLQLAAEGWAFLELEATDISGNQATLRRRVFVDTL